MTRGLRRTALIAGGALLLLVMAALLLGGPEYGLDALKQIESVVEAHYWLALAGFVLSFIALVVLGLPIGTLFCLGGGYLFGILTGTVAALAGASLGASATFLIVRSLGSMGLRDKFDGGISDRLLKRLEGDAAWYLVILRIIPFAPFFPVNAAAAMTRVRPIVFGLATLAGLLPTTLIYAAIGNSLGSALEARALIGPALWTQPAVWVPLVALLALTLVSLWLHHRLNDSD